MIGIIGRSTSCERASTARHSRYWRTLNDLTAHGQSVTLRVRVSRWRCRNPECATAVFGERLPAVAAPRRQHTHRLDVVVHLVGHALGGRAGARLLARLNMVVSADTVLRVAQPHGLLDDVLEFANVPRPVVAPAANASAASVNTIGVGNLRRNWVMSGTMSSRRSRSGGVRM
jgi:pimeloyl-ACP methyl ester carboxylesterase